MFSMKVDFFESSRDVIPQISLNSRAFGQQVSGTSNYRTRYTVRKKNRKFHGLNEKVGKTPSMRLYSDHAIYARTLLKKAKARMKKTHLLFESDIAYISLSYAMSQFRVKWSQRMLRFKINTRRDASKNSIGPTNHSVGRKNNRPCSTSARTNPHRRTIQEQRIQHAVDGRNPAPIDR